MKDGKKFAALITAVFIITFIISYLNVKHGSVPLPFLKNTGLALHITPPQPTAIPSPTLTPTPTIDWNAIHVPEPGEKAGAGVAVPVSVNVAAVGSNVKLREFDISASGGQLSVNRIIVHTLDELTLRFTAADAE